MSIHILSSKSFFFYLFYLYFYIYIPAVLWKTLSVESELQSAQVKLLNITYIPYIFLSQDYWGIPVLLYESNCQNPNHS